MMKGINMHTITVVISPTRDEADAAIEEYDASHEVEPYVKAEKEDWIYDERQNIRMIVNDASDPETKKHYENLLNLNDEDFAKYIMDTADEDDYEYYDDNGNLMSTLNQDGIFDYCSFGGRWEEATKKLQGITVKEYRDLLLSDNPDIQRPGDMLSDEWFSDVSIDDAIDILNDADENDRVWFYDCHY